MNISLIFRYYRVVDEERRLGSSVSSPMKILQTKQMQFGWARVSVLRTWGDPSKDVFIDDYIWYVEILFILSNNLGNY